MVFDFLGDKKKVVIAMAHIGALPGSPLYDADGGVSKLIERVLKDIEALQTGGVDAVMFGNENDRPYVLKAPPEGVAGGKPRSISLMRRRSSSCPAGASCDRDSSGEGPIARRPDAPDKAAPPARAQPAEAADNTPPPPHAPLYAAPPAPARRSRGCP